MVLVCLGALTAHVASAQALFLSTAESAGGAGSIIDGAYSVFHAEAMTRGMAMADQRGALSGSASIASDIAAARLIVLVTVYESSDSARWSELAAAMQSRPDLTVLAFVDGCCRQVANINPFVATVVNPLLPSAWGGISAPEFLAEGINAPLNTGSLYQAPFAAAGLTSMVGSHYGNLHYVPTPYALFFGRNSMSPPPGYSSAYGFFLPQQASNGGRGSCLFMTSDASVFDHGSQPTQTINIVKAFMAAAFDPDGACKLAAAGVPDLVPTLSGNQAPQVGVPTPYQLTVTNQGTAASTDGTVIVTLPANLTVVPGSLPSGCTATAGNAGVSCTLPGLAAGGSTVFSFQAIVNPAITTPAAISAQVVGVTGEVTTINNTTSLSLSGGGVSSIPTLDMWGLLGLGLLLPWLARRRVQR